MEMRQNAFSRGCFFHGWWMLRKICKSPTPKKEEGGGKRVYCEVYIWVRFVCRLFNLGFSQLFRSLSLLVSFNLSGENPRPLSQLRLIDDMDLPDSISL